MRDLVRIGLVLPAVLALGSGCATRGWVHDLVGKREAEVDQRFVQVEGRVTQSDERLGRVQEQVGTGFQRLGAVEARVTDQDQRVDGARARADEVDSRLTRLWKNRDSRSLVEAVEVHFGFGSADLDDGAQTALVGLVKEMKANPQLAVELEGYTDSSGRLDYNLALSQRRVETVRRFLVRQGVELRRINAAGLGPLDDRSLSAQQKRRVTVKLTTPIE